MAVAFLVSGSEDIVFPSASVVRGAYYAENSNIVFANGSEAWGSFVGNQIAMSSSMKFHFDEDLASHWAGGVDGHDAGVETLVWFERVVEPDELRQDRGDPFALLGVQRSELPSPAQSEAPLDLDARQDEVLRQLDELNERIEAVIKEFSPQAAGDGDSPKERHDEKKAA